MNSFSFHGSILKSKGADIKFGFPIEQILAAENLFIVLLDPRSDKKNWGQFPNLFGVDFFGNIIWRAELPTTDTGDTYFDVQLDDGKLIADSVRSFSCEIDPLNGKIKQKIFFK